MSSSAEADEQAFLRACMRQAVDRIPVWLMGQAGPCLPGYRKLQEKYPFSEMVSEPELAARITKMPVEQLGLDAAILFGDLLTPVACAGFDVQYREGTPYVADPVRSEKDIKEISLVDLAEGASFVAEAVRMLRSELTVPLIGFAGAPFTVACCLVEGGTSENFEKIKSMIYSKPAFAWKLLEALADLCARFIELQVEAGVQAVQIFDTYAGALSPGDFGAFELPWLEKIAMLLKDKGVPAIVYVNGVAGILEKLVASGADVIGVDWRMDILEARRRLGSGIALQGNLDPAVLLGPDEVITAKTQELLSAAGGSPGYIFNLGGRLLPQTKLSKIKLLVETVHNFTP